jgi:hypothetical protein
MVRFLAMPNCVGCVTLFNSSQILLPTTQTDPMAQHNPVGMLDHRRVTKKC